MKSDTHFYRNLCCGGLFLLLTGCESIERPEPFEVLEAFPEAQVYRFEIDPLASFYQEQLVGIAQSSFMSEQVSNPYLDLELARALESLNHDLAHPEKLTEPWRGILNKNQVTRLTIASASRTPWHQNLLDAEHKASAFRSNHLLGIAVDLEMKDKPFDVKRRGEDPEVQKCYEALAKVMEKHGLVFTEPIEVDANHVELAKYARKLNRPEFDIQAWYQKNLGFLLAMERHLQFLISNAERGEHQRRLQRLLLDLSDEVVALKKIYQ